MSYLISVVLPVYNSAAYILQTVNSVLDQTYSEFEFIIIDNCSTDGTWELLKKIQDERIKLFRNESNVGAIKNFNMGINYSDGLYIKFIESDDLMHTDCLYEFMHAIKTTNADFYACNSYIIDAGGGVIGKLGAKTNAVLVENYVLDYFWLNGNSVGTPSDVCIKKSILDKIGGFDVVYGTYLNDIDLWIRLSKLYKIHTIHSRLVYVRRHSGQMGVSGAASLLDVTVALSTIDRNAESHLVRYLNSIHVSSEYVLRMIKCLIKKKCSMTDLNKLVNILGTIGPKYFILFLSLCYLPLLLFLRMRAKMKIFKLDF